MDLREHVITADLSMPSSIAASSYGVQMKVLGGGCSGNGTPPPPPSEETSTKPKSKAVRYRECLKNHAASIGGHAIDGCGEFMPSGDDGTMEALKCAACDCHRNFHRREVDGEQPAALCAHCLSVKRRPPSPPLALPPARPPMLMALNSRRAAALEVGVGGEGEEQQLGYGLLPVSPMKKRFRTKFSVDQKEKMCMFAEKLGWRIQKHDEIAVQQFCADVGVKRHVLKVWMHNNKHTFGKKLLPSLSPPPHHHHHHHQLP